MRSPQIEIELANRALLPGGSGGPRSERFIREAAPPSQDSYQGALLGGAIGDALGTPVERRSPRYIRHRHGELRDFVSSRRGGPAGSFSDDTQLTIFTAQAILNAADDHPERFGQILANQLDSIRGIGGATREAINRLIEGTPWWRSGTWSAAGNGVAMRSAPLGLAYGGDLGMLRSETACNAVVTHASSLAVASGIVQAYAVARLARTKPGTLDTSDFIGELIDVLRDYEFAAGVERRPGTGPDEVRLVDRIAELGSMLHLGPADAFAYTHNGAYVLESLPAALWAFLSRAEDPEDVIVVAVNGGYDADTVGAMAGTLAGAYHGASGLPGRWVKDVEGRQSLVDLADRLHRRFIDSVAVVDSSAASAADADRVHVSVLLDRSGSMGGIVDDTIGGFNTFITEQRALKGQCRVTLIQFDGQDPQDTVADAVPVSEMADLDHSTYQPRGATPLLDALGTLVQTIDRRAIGDPDEFQLVAVITDGYENASTRFHRRQIAEMVKDRSDRGWAFVFLGANLDSFAEAGSMGMSRAQAGDWEHSADGVRRSFDALSRSSRRFRETPDRKSKFDLKDRLMSEVRREWEEEERA